jgi:penicillin-binding protein 1A
MPWFRRSPMESLYEELPPVEVAGRRFVGKVVFTFLLVGAIVVGALAGLLIVYSTDLPEVGELERYRPSTITELYDVKGRTIGSFALQRRVLASYDDFPKVLRDAILSTEDKDFEKHWGVDFSRVFGAAWHDFTTGSRGQGASTLTMQLSRNLFLSPERSYARKIQEMMLAIQIERRLTKQQIFTLYANQIFLGHGVYGFEAGSEFYFNKPARLLTLPEAALLAGLPKAPSTYSPINNPEKALKRRNLVINNMLEDGKITREEANAAKASPIVLRVQTNPNAIAPYFVEEVRQYLENKYGSEEVHTGGLKVYTSLDLDLQRAARQAVNDGLAAYERRHGWRGGLENVLISGEKPSEYRNPDWDEPIMAGRYVHALVLSSTARAATLRLGAYTAEIGPKEVAWTGHSTPAQVLAAGDLAYVKVVAVTPGHQAEVTLEQEPKVQAALLAIDNATGDIMAMVGGRDFDESKFNRATQAMRQVGSSFKPYVYTAAIDGGASPEDIILDAPVSFSSASGVYTPHNFDNKYLGNITLRRALADSRNIPALKLAEHVGIRKVIEYARRFGITSPIPPYLPIALGAADMTLMEQTSGFSVFPDDGVRVTPRYVRKVEDYDGQVMEENYPEVTDVIGAPTARTMVSMMQGVTQPGGTAGSVAAKLKGYALAGKTGTTNDFTDAWFIGYSPSLTCGVWVGFDEKKTLGNKETGSVAALPIWIEFMQTALKGRENEQFAPPPPPPARPQVLAARHEQEPANAPAAATPAPAPAPIPPQIH